MLINHAPAEESHVEFVDYTGKYPNLCHGVLTLKIDGKIEKFGDEQKYKRFWMPAGVCMDVSTRDEWAIDVTLLQEEFRKYAAEIDDVFNINVEYGHCGGCK